MALSLAMFESAWNTTTTPKTASVTGALTGDYLVVLICGDQSASNLVSACTTSTTGGTTGTWTEPYESLGAGTTSDWFSSAVAQVTADGTVTVSVARTKAGTIGGMWGFYVLRATGASGVGNVANTPVGSALTVSLTVQATGNGVAFIAGDWNAGAVPTAWVPSTGANLVERSQLTDYTISAAYWASETAGARSYGVSGGGGGSNYRCLAVEIVASGGAPAEVPSPPIGTHVAVSRAAYY